MENSGSVSSNKRRYLRVKASLPIQYKNLRKASDLPSGSLVTDIGEGGVCFKSSKFISLACRLVLEINLPTTQKPVKAISKIAWIKRLPSSDEYEMGNQFLEITKEDRSHINNFVTNTTTTPL